MDVVPFTAVRFVGAASFSGGDDIVVTEIAAAGPAVAQLPPTPKGTIERSYFVDGVRPVSAYCVTPGLSHIVRLPWIAAYTVALGTACQEMANEVLVTAPRASLGAVVGFGAAVGVAVCPSAAGASRPASNTAASARAGLSV